MRISDWCSDVCPSDLLDRVAEAAALLRRRVDQHVQHDRRAAEMIDTVIGDGVEDRLRLDPAQTDMRAGALGDGPGEAPAVAVEPRQRPHQDGGDRKRDVEEKMETVSVRLEGRHQLKTKKN